MQVDKLIRENFLTYASYVIRDRAIPHLDDGLKPVQRRILHTLFEMEDGRFHKVSNVVGQCMRYHPHGESSIYEALVNLANKGLFVETQGNFGNPLTGDGASAPRYIECRLRPLARELLYYPSITTYEASYDGRSVEPVTFPAKVPLVLLLGVEGIAVGMSTLILSHNYGEVLQAMQAALRNEDFTLYPDSPAGGTIDVRDYEDGKGKIRSRARFDMSNEKQIVIRELPYGKSTVSIINSVQAAVKKKKINITEIHDYTTDKVEIVLRLGRGAKSSEVQTALYAFTDCEVSIHLHPLIIHDERPRSMTVSEMIQYHAKHLCGIFRKEFTFELQQSMKKLRAQTMERIFIEERLYRVLEEEAGDIVLAVKNALLPFEERIKGEITTEEVEKLLQIPIHRISRYDRQKEEKSRKALLQRIKEIQIILKDIVSYAVKYLGSLVEAAGKKSGRKSPIEDFEKIVVKEVATRNLNVYYDERGFLGMRVASGRKVVVVSEFDRLLVIREDGRFSVIPVPERLYVGTNMQFCIIADKKELEKIVFGVVYQDIQRQSYIKRCRILQFIIGREYSLVPEGGKLQYLTTSEKGKLRLFLAKGAKTRKKILMVSLEDYPIKSYKVRGKRVYQFPMERVESAK